MLSNEFKFKNPDIYKNNFNFEIGINQESFPEVSGERKFSPMDRSLRRELKSSMGNNKFWFNSTDYVELINIRVKYKNGYFEFLVPKDRVTSSSARLFGLWISVPAIFLIFVAMIFFKKSNSSYNKFSKSSRKIWKR